jgi:hypothetical protein
MLHCYVDIATGFEGALNGIPLWLASAYGYGMVWVTLDNMDTLEYDDGFNVDI